jgi:hypothetical protein
VKRLFQQKQLTKLVECVSQFKATFLGCTVEGFEPQNYFVKLCTVVFNQRIAPNFLREKFFLREKGLIVSDRNQLIKIKIWPTTNILFFFVKCELMGLT